MGWHLLFGGFSITKGYNRLFIRIHPGNVQNRYHKKRWTSEKATPLNYSYMASYTFQAIKLLRNFTDLVVPKDTYWCFRNSAPPEMYKPLQIVGLLPILSVAGALNHQSYPMAKVQGERKLRVKPNMFPSTNGKSMVKLPCVGFLSHLIGSFFAIYFHECHPPGNKGFLTELFTTMIP